MGRTSRQTSPPLLRAGTLWARVAFDGKAVSVTWRLLPVPGLRTRRYPLAQVLAADYVWLGQDGEWHRFGLALRGRKPIRVGVYLGLRGRGRRKDSRWGELVATVNAAVGQRMRCVLYGTVGRPPWSEEVWRRVEALVPELTCFEYSHWRRDEEVGHRQAIEEGVLADLSRADSDVPPPPYPPPRAWHDRPPRGGGALVGRIADPRDDPRERERDLRRAEAWHDLIDALGQGQEAALSARWAAVEAPALLAWGHYYLQRKLNRKPTRVIHTRVRRPKR
ncbi:hypothetical protein [Streptomyces sp. NPDC097640]|uniref:hypothetical protein n=1 Tax=Streptomyces sp. NPDC097640 TaxID=3157229 RepID=UPI003323E1E7